MTPMLSSTAVLEAIASAEFDIWLGLDDGLVPYGSSLRDIAVAAEDPDLLAIGRDWLEAAVRAGHIPHFEGVVLAIHGYYRWLLDDESWGPPAEHAPLLLDSARLFKDAGRTCLRLGSELAERATKLGDEI